MTERPNRIREPLRRLRFPGMELPTEDAATAPPSVVAPLRPSPGRQPPAKAQSDFVLSNEDVWLALGLPEGVLRQQAGRVWYEGHDRGSNSPVVRMGYDWSGEEWLLEWFITPRWHRFLAERLQLVLGRLNENEPDTPRDITAIDSNGLVWIRHRQESLSNIVTKIELGYLGSPLIIEQLSVPINQPGEQVLHDLNGLTAAMALERLEKLALEEQRIMAEQLGIYGTHKRHMQL